MGVRTVCNDCRRENLKLFLKGDRCYTEKCSFERRPYPPGQHGQRRTKFSEFAIQLREKQKVKRLYGLTEEQFRIYVKKAVKKKGITGESLIFSLESRFDEAVYKIGFSASRNQAKQLVRHNHFTVNGKKINIPSYPLKQGDVIEVREKSKKNIPILSAIEGVKRREIPKWLELNADKLQGTVKRLPARADVTVPIQENLIVEFYSR